MEITVDSKIRIKDYTPELLKWCNQELVMDNPEFYKKEKMGKLTGNTPRTISLYEQIGNELWIPFGYLKTIWKMCGTDIPWNVYISLLRRFHYNSDINLYDYQEKAVEEAIRVKNGILVMPCGSGKTQSALEVISRIGGRALWLTHTQELLNQSKDRAMSVMEDVGCGTITAGKVNLGNGITFATIQTMAKIDLTQLKNFWDIIIVDECQRAAGSPTKVTQFYKVLSNLTARYKIGLTATPKRADGLEKSMFALLGGVIHEVDRREVRDTTCQVVVEQRPTGWMPDYDLILLGDGTIDYNKVVDAMIHDEYRYSIVMDCVEKCARRGATLVLGNRVEYLQRMCREFIGGQWGNAICLSGMKQNKEAKAERKKALGALNSGELDCIFATYALAKEGLDVPNLRYVVFATPEKDETTIIQSAGRVGRKAEGKTEGRVIDFVDDFGMCQGWATLRRRHYQKIEAVVEVWE